MLAYIRLKAHMLHLMLSVGALDPSIRSFLAHHHERPKHFAKISTKNEILGFDHSFFCFFVFFWHGLSSSFFFHFYSMPPVGQEPKKKLSILSLGVCSIQTWWQCHRGTQYVRMLA